MMDEGRASVPNLLLVKAKREAAALVLGMPFYGIVIGLTLQDWAELVALASYGLAAGGWVAWRSRRALMVEGNPL